MCLSKPLLKCSESRERCGKNFESQILRTRTLRSEIDLQFRSAELLVIHRVQQLDGDQNFISGFGLFKEHNRFQVIA